MRKQIRIWLLVILGVVIFVMCTSILWLVVELPPVLHYAAAPNTSYQDLSAPDFHLTATYERQMKPNHTYPVRVVLSSSKRNVALSALSGSVIDGQNAPLQTLLVANPCVAASLSADPKSFRVWPPQPQEYSLRQSQITWTWTITPFPADPQTPQEIPVELVFSGKLSCGATDGSSVTGPFSFAENVSLMITVLGPLSSSTQGPSGGGSTVATSSHRSDGSHHPQVIHYQPSLFIFLLCGLLVFALSALLGIFLWRKRKCTWTKLLTAKYAF
jgi:hypothetical protein